MAAAIVSGDIGISADGTTVRLASGPELARDRLHIAFNMAKTTYRFDQNAGFPYQKIFELRGEDEILLAQSVFTRWLLDFDFIVAVDSVTVTYDKTAREYSIAFVATSTYGRIDETFTFGVMVP
jgi:hypothetical protein